MFRNLAKITTISLLVTLTGCSYTYGDKGVIRNRDTEYLKAESYPPLIIPPGLSSDTIQEHYPVSYRNYPGSKDKVDLTPPELNNKSPHPVDTSKIKMREEETLETAQAKPKTEIAKAAPQQHKQRYLTDVFKHPEFLSEGLFPKKTETAAKSSTTTNTVRQTQTAQPVQQAENATVAQPKKKYIMDYFR